MQYVAHISREGKHVLAEFPDCPGCQTFPESGDELEAAAREALEGWLEAHLVDGQIPPRPVEHTSAPQGRKLARVSVRPGLAAALLIRWARHDAELSQKELGVLANQPAAGREAGRPGRKPDARIVGEGRESTRTCSKRGVRSPGPSFDPPSGSDASASDQAPIGFSLKKPATFMRAVRGLGTKTFPCVYRARGRCSSGPGSDVLGQRGRAKRSSRSGK